jgi:hypothetical protein
MHLTLFVLALSVSPDPQVVQPPPQAPPETVAAPVAVPIPSMHNSRLSIRLGLRTRGVTPANAALTFSQLLGDLRDSLHRTRGTDPPLPIEIKSLLPTGTAEDRQGKEYELSLSLTLGPDALPQFLQVLDKLASGTVSVSDLRLGAEGEISELASQMLQAAADTSGSSRSVGSTIGKLSRLALLILAIRREVTR